jgi:hypothetical protein
MMIQGGASVFKFLKRADAEPSADGAQVPPASVIDDVSGTVVAEPANASSSTGDEAVIPAVEPIVGVIGLEDARAAMGALKSAMARSITFVVAPRTPSQTEAVLALVGEVADVRPLPGVIDATVIATDFSVPHATTVLRLPVPIARDLRDGVARAVLTLSHTIPAAFASDSTEVTRLTLEEELRSGHDRVLDALKRKAETQNIGIMRTPRGYTVAPMHDGRVVPPDVFKALPDGLRADVDAKLAAFEGELSGVLADRSRMQRDHRARVIEFESEVAMLAVRPALADVKAQVAANPNATAFLDALSSDLVTNAAQFLPASQRAPIEVANDPRLTRYRINVVEAGPHITRLHDLDVSSVLGVVRHRSSRADAVGIDPMAVDPGGLVRAGSGFVVIDSGAGLYAGEAWSALKRALQAGAVSPVGGRSIRPYPGAPNFPVDARIVVVGDETDCRSWHLANAEIAPSVSLIVAFRSTLEPGPEAKRRLVGHLAGLAQQEGLPTLAASVMSALVETLSEARGGTVSVSTDLDTARSVLVAAHARAKQRGAGVVEADDVTTVARTRRELQGLTSGQGLAPGHSLAPASAAS